MLINSEREHIVDKKFNENVTLSNLDNKFLLRVVAKSITFDKVNFRYTIFDTCYMRDCVFNNCNFTGCRFSGTNFYGSKFNNCEFQYSNFERTIIYDEILDKGPIAENLKLKFARTLRMNFQQIGDSQAVNKAIRVELNASLIHLKKSWMDKSDYYRLKYKGLNRVKMFFKWISFEIFEFLWGNGESAWKLFRSIVLLLIILTIVDVSMSKNLMDLSMYWKSFQDMPSIFLGLNIPSNYSRAYLTLILFIRLIIIGFFLSILIKRYNRR